METTGFTSVPSDDQAWSAPSEDFFAGSAIAHDRFAPSGNVVPPAPTAIAQVAPVLKPTPISEAAAVPTVLVEPLPEPSEPPVMAPRAEVADVDDVEVSEDFSDEYRRV
ncbi:MAG: hypothetical protein NTU50_04995, partial [Actinobacteria bacterium]|nr:hypothetical protein [Actinomycetota bacterium]